MVVVFMIMVVFMIAAMMMLMVLMMFMVVLVLRIMAVFVPMVLMLFLIMPMVLVVLVTMVVAVPCAGFRSTRVSPGLVSHQVHAAFWAAARLVLDNFRVHGADILNPDIQDRSIEILG
jgi:hypothetical protein